MDESNSLLAHRKLLLVDDGVDIVKSFKAGLEAYGYLVDGFVDPEEALENFKPGEYDLLLVDINMPKMDGFKLFKELQKLDAEAKVCFVTAYETYLDAFREIFPDLDIGRYIRKPISIADLAKQVEITLESRASNRPEGNL